jgi:hypothetical protein
MGKTPGRSFGSIDQSASILVFPVGRERHTAPAFVGLS